MTEEPGPGEASAASRFMVRRVAVRGAGVMGAQIAAHCINARVPVLLYDLPDPSGTDRSGIARRAIDGLKKLGPDASPAALNDFIQHQNGWVGINGVYNFTNGSQRGLGIDDVVFDRWDAGKSDFVAVSKGGGAI